MNNVSEPVVEAIQNNMQGEEVSGARFFGFFDFQI